MYLEVCVSVLRSLPGRPMLSFELKAQGGFKEQLVFNPEKLQQGRVGVGEGGGVPHTDLDVEPLLLVPQKLVRRLDQWKERKKRERKPMQN